MPIDYETKWTGIHAWHRRTFGPMQQHLHDYAEIIYVRSGEIVYSINFTEHHLQAGDVIFTFPGQIHGHPASDAENICLLFPKNLPIYDAVLSNMSPADPVLHGAVDTELDALFCQAATANRNKDVPYSKGIAQGYIALILGRLLPLLDLQPVENRANSIERQLIEYCSKHYKEPISLTSVAEVLGYSATHLSHLFSEKFKIGFSKFISTMRVEEAKKMLRGSTPITQIALDCGFGSMRNFNRTFKEATGKTPSRYRDEINVRDRQ